MFGFSIIGPAERRWVCVFNGRLLLATSDDVFLWAAFNDSLAAALGGVLPPIGTHFAGIEIFAY
ncbi:MAG: hypothetical protein ACI915_001641 [Gammaproteobacteria bacterium]|jgi:hypothetical protein